jgi:hypothetical protein
MLLLAASLLAGLASVDDPSLHPVAVPAGERAALPSAVLGADGRVLLTWVERDGAESVLRCSRLGADGALEEPTEIARGGDWFVNWADFPSVAALADGTLCAHFLQRLGEGTYAYGVRITLSRDGGRTWSRPTWLHEDRAPGEHGFVSLAPMGDGFGALWLDGRGTAAATGAEEGHGGPMALYFRTIGRDGRLGEEIVVDERVCDCCQTALAPGSDGRLLAAWRDRTVDERRDLALAVFENELWTEVPGHLDRWVTARCPVNGPAIATGSKPLLAWYTEGRGAPPRVLAAWLGADGAPGEPERLDDGAPLGRVHAIPLGDGALVTWLERRADGAVWRARPVAPDGAAPAFDVAATSLERQSGFLRMAPIDARRALLAWTEEDGVAAAILTLAD